MAENGGAVRVARLPERRLVDPVGLAFDALAEAERLEHLHRPAGDAVGLAELQRAGLLLDDAGLDVGKGGELGGERQAGGAAADDQHIDLFGQHVVAGESARRLRSVEQVGIAGAEFVELELHGAPLLEVAACRTSAALIL